MLSFLLRLILLFWIGFIAFFYLFFALGKTAPKANDIAFFSQNFNGTDYWRLDLSLGVSYDIRYEGNIVTPDFGQTPVQHYLLTTTTSDFRDISELNPQNQELSPIWSYDLRHNQMLLAGDYVFLIDYTNHWSRVHIPSAEFSDFGQYPTLESLRVSPDGAWLAGARNNTWYFINLQDGSSYIQRDFWRVNWSPDSQWYFASSADNPLMISVLNTLDGSPHPILGTGFSAQNATWAEDGQSIFYQKGGHLASISLADGLITEYPSPIAYFVPDCFSPNQLYGLVKHDENYRLQSLATGEILWQLEGDFAVLPSCLWSADSRYLIAYYTVYDYGINGRKDEWERFFVINTQTGDSWDLYPDSLPSLLLYLHFPN
jgi:WD40 repeat protein